MATENREYLISDEQQLDALVSPVRQEIVDVLSELGTVSVNELAAALDRPADGLYYHLKVLKDVGLVVAEGYRQRGTRQEELIRSVSPNPKLRYVLGDKGNVEVIIAIVEAMLRLGMRDFKSAFELGDLRVEGPSRNLLAIRKTAWLTDEELVTVNAAIETLRRATERPPGNGRLFALSMLLTPLRGSSGDELPE